MRSLPWIAFFVVGGLALAQSATPSRKFPYSGFLEENGVAVNGARALQVKLFTSDSTATVCDTQSFTSVDVSAGRFAVTLAGVPDACLTTGELFLEVAVGPVGGTLTSLSTGVGSGRSAIAATPFAAAVANAKAFMVGSGGMLFDRSGGQTRIGTDVGATAIILQPTTDIPDANALLLIRSADGTERVRVNDNDAVTINERLTVTGGTTLQATTTTSLTASGNTTVGGSLTVNKVARVSTINFPAQVNDPGAIIHVENDNDGQLWLDPSDDFDIGQTQDLIIFGERDTDTRRHVFDGAGNVDHDGDMTLGGAISSSCPSGMSFAGGWCIDNGIGGSTTHGSAMSQCGNAGKMVCPYEAFMACDHFRPGGSACSSTLNNSGSVLWTSTRHTERDDHDESWHTNIACYKGDRTVQECNVNQNFSFFCCTHAYPGTP